MEICNELAIQILTTVIPIADNRIEVFTSVDHLTYNKYFTIKNYVRFIKLILNRIKQNISFMKLRIMR